MDVADLLAQTQGSPTKGIDAPPYFWQAKSGLGRSDADICGQQQLHSPTRAVAVDGGNDGLAVDAIFQQALVDHLRQLWSSRKITCQLRSGAERLFPRSRQDDTAVRAGLQPQP